MGGDSSLEKARGKEFGGWKVSCCGSIGGLDCARQLESDVSVCLGVSDDEQPTTVSLSV